MDDEVPKTYIIGSDMWYDVTNRYGIDEATIICGRYLDLNLRRDHAEDEGEFCRDLFKAMYEATAHTASTKRIVYPFSLKEADKRMESSYFHANSCLNQACSRSIDEAISASHYHTYHYNLEIAAMKVIQEYGFGRVNAVLAHHVRGHKYDGRYSSSTKDWAASIPIPAEASGHVFINSHATLVEDVIKHTRKLYLDLDAGRFALPGTAEHGAFVKGYEVKQAIMIDEDRGYAIAYNPDAVESFVCWQFYIREGERHYNWGVYGKEQVAIDVYNARLFVAFNPLV